MSDDLILEHGAPTLAGLKTGNLISCPYQSREEVLSDVRRLNGLLRDKGLCMIPLKYMSRRVLIYLYRPQMLLEDLSKPSSRRILEKCGYQTASGKEEKRRLLAEQKGNRAYRADCLRILVQKLQNSEDFPHEIGLFLGYPPEDVLGFIENHGENSKLTGVWKVYGDPEASRIRFEQFRTCTRIYCKAFRRGVPLAKLAVAR